MKKYLLIPFLFLSACSSNNKELYTNDYGYGTFETTCETLGKCYQSAYKQCSGRFEKLDRVVLPKGDKPINLIYECR